LPPLAYPDPEDELSSGVPLRQDELFSGEPLQQDELSSGVPQRQKKFRKCAGCSCINVDPTQVQEILESILMYFSKLDRIRASSYFIFCGALNMDRIL
jgi:hypothetical protein